jgi:hypothetical protein
MCAFGGACAEQEASPLGPHVLERLQFAFESVIWCMELEFLAARQSFQRLESELPASARPLDLDT